MEAGSDRHSSADSLYSDDYSPVAFPLEVKREPRCDDSFEESSDDGYSTPSSRKLPSEWCREEVLRWLIYQACSSQASQSGIQSSEFPFERFNAMQGTELLEVTKKDLDFLPPVGAEFLLEKISLLTSTQPAVPESESPNSKEPRLWSFILDELLHPDPSSSPLVKWINRKQGIFQIIDSKALARKWGIRKNHGNMSYANLSRGIRYYYKKNIILPMPHKRLVYKFGPKSKGW